MKLHIFDTVYLVLSTNTITIRDRKNIFMKKKIIYPEMKITLSVNKAFFDFCGNGIY